MKVAENADICVSLICRRTLELLHEIPVLVSVRRDTKNISFAFACLVHVAFYDQNDFAK